MSGSTPVAGVFQLRCGAESLFIKEFINADF